MHTSLDHLTAAPKNQYFVGASWRLVPKLLMDIQLRGIGGLYVGEDVKNQNYALLNLKATYSPMTWLDVFAHFDNLTDTKYTINRGYEMPGFTAMFGFKVKM
jgi:iron complex outermembrane receptor protein